MKNCARISIFGFLALVGVLASCGFALAEDYSVDFGADTDRGRDAGTIQCRFDQICHAKMESLGLTAKVEISRGGPAVARVELDRDDLGCCYFDNTASSMAIDLRKPLSTVPLFKGWARGALFIENKRVGLPLSQLPLALTFHR